MINQVPGRRGGAVSGAAVETARLTISGAEIQKIKPELVGILQDLQIGYVALSGGSVTIEVDARAIYVAPIYVRALENSLVMAKEAQITGAELDGLLRRERALVVLMAALSSVRAQLIGTRLIVAAAQGRMWDALVADLQRDLADEGLSEAERAQLRVDAAEVLMQVEREQAEKRRRLDELKGARTAAAQQVADATARRRQLQALLNLQDQQEIDPEMLDELQRIYVDRVRVPGEEERRAPR